jgi:hypothetical protein
MTNIAFKAKRLYTWDGQDVDTENYEVASETCPQCSDCGKAVRALFN